MGLISIRRLVWLIVALQISSTVRSAPYQDPSWVLPGEAVPSDSIRLIALGTGTPSVYKEQASPQTASEMTGHDRKSRIF